MSKRNYIIPIFVPHKGCPHNCIFCNQKMITGQEKGLTGRDIDDIIKGYLNTINKKDANIEIAFFGGSFTAIPKKEQNLYLSIANKYLKRKMVNAIRLSTRPDYIDNDILNNLKDFGVTIVELGAQSLDEEVLSFSQRGHSTKDLINAAKLLKEKGFILGMQLMVGLPKDSEYKSMETVKKAIDLKPDIARIYPSLVIRNTYMEQLYNQGEYEPLQLVEAVDISKKMLIKLENNNIKVIRIGLQPTDDMQLGKNIIAGPYHPAFRQLVESEIFKDMILHLFHSAKIKDRGKVKITLNPKDYSNAIGHKRSNMRFFKKEYPDVEIELNNDRHVDLGCILLNTSGIEITLTKKDYYKLIDII